MKAGGFRNHLGTRWFKAVAYRGNYFGYACKKQTELYTHQSERFIKEQLTRARLIDEKIAEETYALHLVDVDQIQGVKALVRHNESIESGWRSCGNDNSDMPVTRQRQKRQSHTSVKRQSLTPEVET